MENGIIVEIGKTAIMTLVVSKIAQAIGEKDIADIVVCVGAIACGVYIIQGVTPLIKGMQEFGANWNAGMQGLNNILDKLTFWK